MRELVRVPLRAIGVVLPGAVVLGVAELRGGAADDGFGTFLGAMALSLLAAAVWSATDARRARPVTALLRWLAVTVVLSATLAVVSTMMAPGSPPGTARVAEAVQLTLFYAVPMLVAVGIGVAAGQDR